MPRYRVTIPPFEVDATDSFEAEHIVDRLIYDDEAFDYIIEEITPGGFAIPTTKEAP